MKKEGFVVDKKKLKKLIVKASLGGALVASCISGAVVKAKEGYQHHKGAEYIAKNVSDCGILPRNMSVRDDSQAGYIFMYEDASGRYQQVIDVESLFNDMAAEASDFGITADHLAVAVDYLYGYDTEIEGATKEGMEIAEMNAYWELQAQMLESNNKGVSR